MDGATAKCFVLYRDGETEWVSLMPWQFEGSNVGPECPRTCRLEALLPNTPIATITCSVPIQTVSMLLTATPSLNAPLSGSTTYRLYENIASASSHGAHGPPSLTTSWSTPASTSSTLSLPGSLSAYYMSRSESIPLSSSSRHQIPPSTTTSSLSQFPAAPPTTRRVSTRRRTWSKQEDFTLFRLQHQLGNRWTDIAKYLPGRSENQAKNRWHSVMRRHPLWREKIMKMLEKSPRPPFAFSFDDDEDEEETGEGDDDASGY